MSIYDNLPLVRSPGAVSGLVGKHLCLLQVLFLTYTSEKKHIP
jgi:hypothetical protein